VEGSTRLQTLHRKLPELALPAWDEDSNKYGFLVVSPGGNKTTAAVRGDIDLQMALPIQPERQKAEGARV